MYRLSVNAEPGRTRTRNEKNPPSGMNCRMGDSVVSWFILNVYSFMDYFITAMILSSLRRLMIVTVIGRMKIPRIPKNRPPRNTQKRMTRG